MAFWAIALALSGGGGGVNILGPEDENKPLTPEQILAAKKAQEALNQAGDPAQYYQEPYTGFLTDCCRPHLLKIYGGATSGATVSSVMAETAAYAKEAQKFVDEHGIQVPKEQPRITEPMNPWDQAIYLCSHFYKTF